MFDFGGELLQQPVERGPLVGGESGEHFVFGANQVAGQAFGFEDTVIGEGDREGPAIVPAVGDLHGIDALAGFLLETAGKTNDGEHIELLDTLTGESHAALYFRITATRAGREPLDNLTVHLARVQAGKIQEIWFHNFDSSVVAAFWD